MPTYEITAPNGKTYRIDGPAGASQADVQNAVLGQHPEAAYGSYRDYLRASNPAEYDPSSEAWRQKYGAQSGSTWENLRAGAGKGMTDLVRGAGQFVGLVDRQDVADYRARDADLMSTGAGKWGSVAGTAIGSLPTVFIPGANTYLGATAIGAGLGALQPSTSTKETLTNTGVGAVLSPLTMLAGRGLVGAAKAGKAAFIDPFTKAGQERIAANTLRAAAGSADDVAKAAQSIRTGMQDVLPGAQPTTAEVANNAGIANLERVMKNNPEFIPAFANRSSQNRNAIMSAMDDIAGDDVARSAAVSARDQATSGLYGIADDAVTQADDAFNALMQRPSMGKALDRVKELAEESGEVVDTDKLTGRTLHYFKKALDDLTEGPAKNDLGKNQLSAMRNTRAAFLDWVEQRIPEYGQARTTFAEMSKPINQMDIGTALRNKLFPAISDMGAETRLRPNAFAQAMREGDATASRALGRNGASITDILSPEQMKTLGQVGKQLAGRVNADELGRAVGSNTGQNLVGQNALRQMLGPLGLSDNLINRAVQGPIGQGILGAPSKIAQSVTGTVGEPGVLKRLVELGLSPEDAIKVLEAQIAASNTPQFGRYVAPMISGANAASQ